MIIFGLKLRQLPRNESSLFGGIELDQSPVAQEIVSPQRYARGWKDCSHLGTLFLDVEIELRKDLERGKSGFDLWASL